MGFFFRTPNLKKSLAARTTGKWKRAAKRKLIPGYGKKGMGFLKNPKKALYNYGYSRTTIGFSPSAVNTSIKTKRKKNNSNYYNYSTNYYTSVPKMKFCSKCGFKLTDGSIYCGNCGKKV